MAEKLKKGIKYDGCKLQCHLTDWYQYGMTHDPDGTGLENIGQAAWGALVLLAYALRGVGTDDRPKTEQPEQLAGAFISAVLYPDTLNVEP